MVIHSPLYQDSDFHSRFTLISHFIQIYTYLSLLKIISRFRQYFSLYIHLRTSARSHCSLYRDSLASSSDQRTTHISARMAVQGIQEQWKWVQKKWSFYAENMKRGQHHFFGIHYHWFWSRCIRTYHRRKFLAKKFPCLFMINDFHRFYCITLTPDLVL